MSDRLFALLLIVMIRESRGLTRYNQNTCFNKSTRAYYCCSDYEEINYECIECKTGFNSRNGKGCEPCLFGLFGKGCSQQCICNDLQRCDVVEGCVELERTGTQESLTTTVNKDDDKNGNGILKTELLVLYSGASSGIIVILGVLGILYCFKRRICKSKSKHVTTSERDVLQAAYNVRHDSFALNERLYEEIDESKLENILQPRTYCPNLKKEGGSLSFASTLNYNLHTTDKSFCHANVKSLNMPNTVPLGRKSNRTVFYQSSRNINPATEENSSSSGSTDDFNIDRTSYLHPYNTLASKRSYSHKYEEITKSTTESN